MAPKTCSRPSSELDTVARRASSRGTCVAITTAAAIETPIAQRQRGTVITTTRASTTIAMYAPFENDVRSAAPVKMSHAAPIAFQRRPFPSSNSPAAKAKAGSMYMAT